MPATSTIRPRMHPHAAALIERLRLRPHPEGGYYREVFRSPRRVRPEDQRPARSALTSIHFLLVEGQQSRWHRVASDEAWHHHQGAPLELLWLDDELRLQRARLGPTQEDAEPLVVVPAGCWQAARPLGAFALVGCTVGPGFEFEDFQMLSDAPREAEAIRARHPELSWLI